MGVNYRRGESSIVVLDEPLLDESPFTSSSSPPDIQTSKSNDERSSDQMMRFHQHRQFQRSSSGLAPSSPGRGRNLQRTGSGSGDSDPPITEGERRARSLSRGRLPRRWPPENRRDSSPIRGGGGHNFAPQSPSRVGYKSRISASGSELSSPKPYSSVKNNIDSSESFGTFDSAKDERLPGDGDVATTTGPVPSVKDRINVFGGVISKGKRSVPIRPVIPGYAAQFAVRELPPKIDIYAQKPNQTVSEDEEEKKEDFPDTPPHDEGVSGISPNPRFIKKVPSGDSSAAVKTFRKSPGSGDFSSSRSNNTIRKNSAKVATTFLAAVHQPDKMPGSMKPGASPTNTANEKPASTTNLASVGSTSTFEDDFAGNNDAALESAKGAVKPWSRGPQERNRLAAYGGTGNGSTGNPATSTISEVAIQKMIEERVQAHIESLEVSMEAKTRRMLQKVEDRMELRLGALEERVLFLESELGRMQHHHDGR